MAKAFLVLLASIGLLAGASTASAQVTLFTAPSSMTTDYFNDFETAANTGPVTFVDGVRSAAGGSTPSTPSGDYGLTNSGSPGSITAQFSSGSYSAVGFYFGNDDTCCESSMVARISAYNGATLLGTVQLAANMNDATDQFIGLRSTTPFDSVVIDYAGADLYTFIDDFRLEAAVPEPGSWAMMLLGFGIAGRAIRRRKAAPAPSLAPAVRT